MPLLWIAGWSAHWTSFFGVIGLLSQFFCRNLTLFTKSNSLIIITKSMVLKFFLQSKHLARLVSGLTAVLNALHRGQRKRRYPSPSRQGTPRTFSINESTGISLRRAYSWRSVKRRFVILGIQFAPQADTVFHIDDMAVFRQAVDQCSCQLIILQK